MNTQHTKYNKVRIVVEVFHFRAKERGGLQVEIFGIFAFTTIAGFIFSWAFVAKTKKSLMAIQIAIGWNSNGYTAEGYTDHRLYTKGRSRVIKSCYVSETLLKCTMLSKECVQKTNCFQQTT